MAIADPWLIDKRKVMCTSTHSEPYEYYVPVPDPNVACCPSIFGIVSCLCTKTIEDGKVLRIELCEAHRQHLDNL